MSKTFSSSLKTIGNVNPKQTHQMKTLFCKITYKHSNLHKTNRQTDNKPPITTAIRQKKRKENANLRGGQREGVGWRGSLAQTPQQCSPDLLQCSIIYFLIITSFLYDYLNKSRGIFCKLLETTFYHTFSHIAQNTTA